MTQIPEDIKKLSFEKAMEELTEIVDNLESGNIDLEKSIENYTRGSQLRAHCQKKLDDAVPVSYTHLTLPTICSV